MSISAVGGSPISSLMTNPIQNLGFALITTLFINTFQNSGKAEAFSVAEVCVGAGKVWKGGTWMAGQACYKVGSLALNAGNFINGEGGSKAISLIDNFSKWSTFKTITDKCFDAALLTNPQFAIPFRLAMTGGSLGMEYWTCLSISDAYLKCSELQLKVFKECNDNTILNSISWITGKTNAFSKCSEIKDEKGKDHCYTSILNDFNEENIERKNKSPTFGKCVESIPGCTSLWLQRKVACTAFAGHGFMAAGRFIIDLSKDFVPAPMKTAIKAADIATSTLI